MDVESKFINSSLTESYKLFDVDSISTLCVFPFNLIGNLDDLTHQIKQCYESEFDLIISQFNTTKHARNVRQKYYRKCGISNLIEIENAMEDVFVSEMFKSKSYNSEYLLNCALSTGFENIENFLFDLICIYYFSGGKR